MRAHLVALLRFRLAVPVALAIVVAVLPSLGVIGPLVERELQLAGIYALIVVGFNLSFGFGGQLALGQVAVFAGGAYSTAILYNHGSSDLALAAVVALAIAAALGLLTGLPGLRFASWSLALVGFFLVLLIPQVAALFPGETGGPIGISGILGPELFGQALSPTGFYVVCVVVVAVTLFLYRNLVTSRFGHSLLVLKQGKLLAQSLGLSPYRLRLSAYVLCGLPAGLAGVLYAYYSTYVQQDFFSFNLVILLLAASVLGGTKSIWAVPVATTILVIGPDRASAFNKYSVLVYGLFLMLTSLGLAGGLAAVGRRMLRAALGGRADTVNAESPISKGGLPAQPRIAIAGAGLRTSGVAKRFGGVQAVAGVDFEANPGEITAIIGANGAGKTTLLNIISGMVAPDAGEIELGGDRIHRLSPERIARAGISRTFQTPEVPEGLTALEVATSGCFAERRIPAGAIMMRLPMFIRARRAEIARAYSALEFVGLEGEAGVLASKLPLGRRRLLEVARSVAGDPSVILLDEPAAGLDAEALAKLHAILTKMRELGATVVLIEHNVSFVFNVADAVYVMDLGAVIATGTPADVQRDERVIASYLGRRATRHRTLDDMQSVGVPDAR